MNYTRSALAHGYAGKLLTIDLDRRSVETPELDPKIRDYFIGGRGLGLYLLHRRLTPRTTPDAPENPLIFAPGPLGVIPDSGNEQGISHLALPADGHRGLEPAAKPTSSTPGSTPSNRREGLRGRHDHRRVPAISSRTRRRWTGLRRGTDDRRSLRRAGHERRNIVFLTTGVGAAVASAATISTRPSPWTGPGPLRVKQAGRTDSGP